jgi:hypothetical protein
MPGILRYPEFNLGYLSYNKDLSIREYILAMLLIYWKKTHLVHLVHFVENGI